MSSIILERAIKKYFFIFNILSYTVFYKNLKESLSLTGSCFFFGTKAQQSEIVHFLYREIPLSLRTLIVPPPFKHYIIHLKNTRFVRGISVFLNTLVCVSCFACGCVERLSVSHLRENERLCLSNTGLVPTRRLVGIQWTQSDCSVPYYLLDMLSQEKLRHPLKQGL